MKTEKIQANLQYRNIANTFGQAGYDIHSALYELLDNSLGANASEITVELYCDKQTRIVDRIVVTDNGGGIPKDDLGDLLTPATVKGSGLNEHGVGMKAAIAWLGGHSIVDGLDYIETNDGTNHYRVVDLDNEITIENQPFATGTYTSVSVNVAAVRGVKAKFTYPYTNRIGRRYGRYIRNGSTITLDIVDKDTDSQIKSIDVDGYAPPYLNPSDSTCSPIGNWTITNAAYGYECTLFVGKVDPDKTGPTKPWGNPGTGKGGIDIILNDRVLVEQTALPLNLVGAMDHPNYNDLVGQLVVTKGLATTPKKNGIEVDTAFEDLQSEIKVIWDDNNLNQYFKSKPKKGPSEAKVRDNLAKYLKQEGWKEVGTEKHTYFGTRMDVVGKKPKATDKTVFEVKTEDINPAAVNQLVGYMMAEGCLNGVLVGPNMSKDAQAYLKKVKEYHPTFKIAMWNYKKQMKYQSLLQGA